MQIFRLNFEDGSQYTFDADSTTLYDPAGHAVEIDDFLRDEEPADNSGAWRPDGLVKGRAPSFVRVVFGYRCNYHCKYCSQSLNDKQAGTSVEDAVAFAKRFCALIDGQPCRIEFWGGEPLVYYKHLKAVLPIFRERFPDSVLAIITNGSIINRDILETLKKYRIRVAISHDGPGQHIRGEDPLLDPKKVALWREYYEFIRKENERPHQVPFSFTATMSRDNCDITEIVKYIRAHFAPDVPVFCDVVSAMGDIEETSGYKSVGFTEESLKRLERGIYRNLRGSDDLSCLTVDSVAKKFLIALMHRHKEFGSSICGSDGQDKLFVKIDGTVLACQNYDVPKNFYGSVWDLDKVRITTAHKWKDRESCTHCPFISLCIGNCPMQGGNAFAESCKVKSAYYRSYFRYIIECAVQKKLISMEGDFRVPEKQLIETKKGRCKKVSKIVFEQ